MTLYDKNVTFDKLFLQLSIFDLELKFFQIQYHGRLTKQGSK